MTDPDTALIMLNTIGSVLGPDDDEGPKTVGLEVAVKAVDATEVRKDILSVLIFHASFKYKGIVKALTEMEVASPDTVIDPAVAVTSACGKVLETMLPSMPEPSENATEDADPCAALAPIDKANADKPGVVEYETDIGDSGIQSF